MKKIIQLLLIASYIKIPFYTMLHTTRMIVLNQICTQDFQTNHVKESASMDKYQRINNKLSVRVMIKIHIVFTIVLISLNQS